MFDIKSRTDDYKSSKISIGPVMKNPGMFWCFNVFFAFIYISNWCKTQEMCGRVNSEDRFSIRNVPDQYKTRYKCVMKPLIIV